MPITYRFTIDETSLNGRTHICKIEKADDESISITEIDPPTGSNLNYTILETTTFTSTVCSVKFSATDEYGSPGFICGGSNNAFNISINVNATGISKYWQLTCFNIFSGDSEWTLGESQDDGLSGSNVPVELTYDRPYVQLIPLNSIVLPGGGSFVNTDGDGGGAPNSNTCFVAGTPVNTDQGPIPIEQLDHTTNTIDGQPIVAISKIVSTDSHLIFLKANCLGPNQPSQDTTVSKLHKILYAGIMFPALNLPNTIQIPYNGQPLYNVLLENYSTMTVNNLTVETLHPRSNIAVLYKYITTNNIDTVEKNKLIGLLNNKLDKTNNLRKAFFSNIVTVIMLNILTEPKEEPKVTPSSLIKSFLPNAAFVSESNPLF